jgi:amino acid permease
VCFESDLTKCGKKNLYIGLTGLFLMPVCWFRSMNYLAYVSMASNVCLFLSCKLTFQSSFNSVIVFVIIKYALTSELTRAEPSSQLNYFTPSALPFFFGVAVFDFEGNGIVLNIHASMREPQKF